MRGFGRKLRAIAEICRGFALRRAILAAGGQCGRGLTAERGARLHRGAVPGLTIGEDVHLGVGALIQVERGAELTVGSRCKLMHYTVIACQGRLTIGEDSQVAEHSSVRDAEHGLARHAPIRDQEVVGETRIGSNVWIGRGCAVLMGSDVGDGAVIGANSVVRGRVPAYAIAVGAPARVVRHR